MIRRLRNLPRSSALRLPSSRRAFSKPSTPLSTSTRLSNPDVLFELSASKVGNEIRKRGMASALSVAHRDGGMDRVSRFLSTKGATYDGGKLEIS